MNPIAMGIYLLGITLFVGGILFFILRRSKAGIGIALFGVIVAVIPFALNVWLMHGE